MEQKGKGQFSAHAYACWIWLFISPISLFENLLIWLGKMLSNPSLCVQLPLRRTAVRSHITTRDSDNVSFPHQILLITHLLSFCLPLQRGFYSTKGTPNLLQPFHNAGNSTIKFVNRGASPAMSCSSYLFFSCHWYGAKCVAVATQGLMKEHRQEWGTVPPSLHTPTGFGGSL